MIICSIQIYAVSAEEINLNAKAAVIMDAESGKILYEKSKDQKMPNASTTKILTCLYILKHCDLDQMAEVSKNAAMQPKVRLGVREGEKYKVKDLLYGLMLESYNDCAVVLAEHAEGSVEKFEKILSVLDRSLGTRKKCHIAGGILMSISLMFGGFALTVITLNIGKDKIADINNTIPESKNKRIEDENKK